MTRVLLITPYGYENQGVRMLSAVLRRDGFEAPILYMKAWRNNDIHPPTETELRLFQQVIRQQAPDLIGIGFGTPYLRIVTELTRLAREVSDAHVIWGGVHPTISPEDCIEHADSVCIGEGEPPLLDLAKAIRDGESIDGIANLWVRHGDEVIRNPPRPLVQDLDTLPFPDRDLYRDHLAAYPGPSAPCWVGLAPYAFGPCLAHPDPWPRPCALAPVRLDACAYPWGPCRNCLDLDPSLVLFCLPCQYWVYSRHSRFLQQMISCLPLIELPGRLL